MNLVGHMLPDEIKLARRGLKFGIYGDIGTHTCGGYPGMQDNFHRDAQTYADWGVDYLKASGSPMSHRSAAAGMR